MSTRKLVALAAVAPLVLGVAAADAAAKKKPAPKKPTCKLVNDVAGDGTGTGTAATLPNDPALDIISADIASNATLLTAVIRVANLDGSGNSSQTGRGYEVAFKVNNQIVNFTSIVGPGGDKWADGNGTGSQVPAAKEIRVTVPIAKLSTPFKPGAKITEIQVNTWRWVSGTNAVIGRADTVTGATPYIAAWPSCVKVGA